MVICEITRIASVSKETIWKFWTDVAHWHEWDHDIEWAKLDGEFGLHQTGQLKPKKGSVVTFEIVECTPFKSFLNESKLFLAVIRFDHIMEETNAGLQLTVSVTINGPLAFFFKWILAKDLCKGFDDQMVNLIKVAEEYENQKK